MLKKIAVITLGLMFITGLAACSNQEVDAGSYYVSVDINPSVEFIVDENDIVTSYNLLNEDAEILILGSDVEFIGMNVDEAIELFVQMATESGFIDVEAEDNAVLITVLGEDENQYTERIRNRIKERIGRYFVRNYITGEILTDEFTDEDLVAQAEQLGVSPGKLSLALLILQSETDDVYVLEELLELPIKDLVILVREYHQESIEAYRADKIAECQQKREELMQQHEERFTNWVNNHPNLTEEQIDTLWENYQNRVKNITRERWQNRLEEWQNNRNQNIEE